MENNSNAAKKDHRSAWNWLISIVINLAILGVVLYAADILYESNDDFAISQMIVAKYPYVGFVNYYLCKALIVLQGCLPEMNAFVLSQMAVSFISLCVILKVFLDRWDSAFEVVTAVFVIAFFSLDHYSSVQFTKTSALLMTAGLIWVVDNYVNERRFFGFVFGFALFCLGVAYRQKAMFPALGYAALFMFIFWISSGREFFAGKKAWREICLVIIVLVFLLAPYGFDKASDRVNESTPELKYAREYQAERILVTDYPLTEYYEQNEKEYKEAGFGYNDLDMIDRWLFDYDGAASLENLKKINEINKPNLKRSAPAEVLRSVAVRTGRSVRDRDFNGMHIIIAACIALYILIANRPKALIYVLAIGLFSAALYFAIVYMQRPQYRALYVADAGAAFWMMYAAMANDKRNGKPARILGAIMLTICSAVIILLAPNAVSRLASMSYANSTIVEAQEVTDYFAENTDKYYIGPTTTMKQPASYTTPLRLPTAPVNVSGTGGWETLTPYKLGLLGRYGVHNPIKDLIDAEDVYFFGDGKIGMLKDYYRKWYCEEGETVEFIKVDEVNGNGIYKVVKWR